MSNNIIKESGKQRYTWDSKEKIENKTIVEIVNDYISGIEIKTIKMYKEYYEGLNTEMVKRYKDKEYRHKNPNTFLPTGYYSTIVDSMAGFLFNDVVYTTREDTEYLEALNQILKNNRVEVKDMISGTNALAFNKAIELVYTVGDGNTSEIKFTSIDPLQMILVYNSDIEPVLIAGIYITASSSDKYDYNIDVIYKDEWQYYKLKGNDLTKREEPRELFFSECPIVSYQTEIINSSSSFAIIIPYIDALDFLVSGNSNEIDRLVDAILVVGKNIKDEDLQHMDEWKLLEGFTAEDRAEYITKDMSPEFREYVSKLLINEIHKHSHVIDWYSPDSGMGGEVSAKALITRLFDMDLYSKRIEKAYRAGARKRISLITEMMSAKNMPIGKVEIIFNRTLPNMMIDTAIALKDVPFISDKTKVELVGLDWEDEKKNKEEQGSETDITDLFNQNNTNFGV